MIAIVQRGIGHRLPFPSDVLVEGAQAKGHQVLKQRKGVFVAHDLKMEMGLK